MGVVHSGFDGLTATVEAVAPEDFRAALSEAEVVAGNLRVGKK